MWQLSHPFPHSSSQFSCSCLPDGSHTRLGGCSPMRRSTSPRRKVGCCYCRRSFIALLPFCRDISLAAQTPVSHFHGKFPLGPCCGEAGCTFQEIGESYRSSCFYKEKRLKWSTCLLLLFFFLKKEKFMFTTLHTEGTLGLHPY